MNKYEKAYNDVVEVISRKYKMDPSQVESHSYMKALKEIISKYGSEKVEEISPSTKLETTDKLEDNLVGNVISNGESLTGFKKEASVPDADKLEKALDNACKILSEKVPVFVWGRDGYLLGDLGIGDYLNIPKDRWKEELLKDE